MVFSADSRARAREAEPLWAWKLALRLLTLLFAILALGLAGYTFQQSAFGLIWLAIPLAVSIIWNTAVVLVRLLRGRPMHPGACVGCDLVIWLAFIVALLFSLSLTLIWRDLGSPPDPEDEYYYGTYEFRGFCNELGSSDDSNSCEAVYTKLASVGLASCVLGIFTLVLHFVLFVWACVDTHRRNKASQNARAGVIATEMVQKMQQHEPQTSQWNTQTPYPSETQQHGRGEARDGSSAPLYPQEQAYQLGSSGPVPISHV